jgi:hypothetical protein
MHNTSRTAVLLGAALLAALGLTAAPRKARAQGLNGQAIRNTSRFPTPSAAIFDNGTQTVTPGGVSYTGRDSLTTTLLPAQVTFTIKSGLASLGVVHAVFNGVVLSEVGTAPARITGVRLISSTVSGFDASRAWCDTTNIYVNFQGLQVLRGQSVVLAITTAPSRAPGG